VSEQFRQDLLGEGAGGIGLAVEATLRHDQRVGEALPFLRVPREIAPIGREIA